MKPVESAGTLRLGDLLVRRLGFGAMRVAGLPHIWGEPRDRGEMRRLLRRAVDLGHNFFDTADSYGPNVSEEILAEALHPYPRDLVIATKGGLLRPRPSRWDPDGRPEHLRRAVEASLRRLRLERIDLYQLHAPDPKVPLAESLGALTELQRQGKIRHIGISNVTAKELSEARRAAPIVSVQNEYNLGNRSSDDVLAACERDGIAFIAWYPLGDGEILARRTVKSLAKKRGASPSQIALAWLLARSSVLLPIPGTHSIAHLEENAQAATVTLSKEDLAALG